MVAILGCHLKFPCVGLFWSGEGALASVPLRESAEEQMKNCRFYRLAFLGRSWMMSFPIAAPGITAQFKPAGTVDKPVEDRIGDGGLCDLTVPFGHRQLAGDDFGLTGQAIIEDFEAVASAGGIKRCQAPIVENDHIGPIEVLIEFGDGAFAMRDTQITEPVWQAQMQRLETFETGFVGQGAGNPCLARSAGAGDEDIRTLVDPAAIGEGEHDAAIEATWARSWRAICSRNAASMPGRRRDAIRASQG